MLFIGLESVNQASLNAAAKGHNQVQRYRELVRRVHKHGIAIQTGIMFGFDSDDRDVFARTVDVMRRLVDLAAELGADVLVHPRGSDTLAAALPDATLLRLDDCGHAIPRERPADFNDALFGHFRSV